MISFSDRINLPSVETLKEKNKAITEKEVKNHTGVAARLNGLLTDKGDGE